MPLKASEMDGVKAMIDLNIRIKADPNNTALLEERSRLYSQGLDYENGIADLTRALEIKPSAALYLERADLYRDDAQLDRALQDFKRVIELDPKNQNAFADIGNLELSLHHWDKAIAAFSRLLVLNPGRSIERMHRAEIYLKLNKPSEALRDVDLVLKSDPSLYVGCNEIAGSAYLQLKQYDKAEKALSIALSKKNIFHPEVYKARAEAYDKLNKPELARRDRLQLKKLHLEFFGDAPFRTK